jgi:hypothetical protein
MRGNLGAIASGNKTLYFIGREENCKYIQGPLSSQQ